MRLKNLLLVLTALVAMAFAAPAGASALTLKDQGNEVKDKDFVQVGNFKFLTPGGSSISCPMKFTFTIDGKIVTVTKFELTVGGCTLLGLFGNCTVTKYAAEGLAWAVTVDATELTIKDVTVKTTFGSVKGKVCPYDGLKVTYEPWTATPGNPKAITGFVYSGMGKGELEEEKEKETELAIEIKGESHGEEENATYEIA